jgi:hypothetical protein
LQETFIKLQISADPILLNDVNHRLPHIWREPFSEEEPSVGFRLDLLHMLYQSFAECTELSDQASQKQLSDLCSGVASFHGTSDPADNFRYWGASL